MTPAPSTIGAVVIGRNEGQRLINCLASMQGEAARLAGDDLGQPDLVGPVQQAVGVLNGDDPGPPTVLGQMQKPDVDQIDGTYGGASITHALRAFDRGSLDLGLDLGWGSAGYNRGYHANDAAGFNNLAVTASLPWRPLPLWAGASHNNGLRPAGLRNAL